MGELLSERGTYRPINPWKLGEKVFEKNHLNRGLIKEGKERPRSEDK